MILRLIISRRSMAETNYGKIVYGTFLIVFLRQFINVLYPTKMVEATFFVVVVYPFALAFSKVTPFFQAK